MQHPRRTHRQGHADGWLRRMPTLTSMRDSDVRFALRGRLALEHQHELDDTLFVEELGLCGAARVDVAVVNGALSGYELKSARDTLDRLPAQVATYSKVLDYAVLVVAENHLKHARRELRPWWGIQIAREVDGVVLLTDARVPRQNPRVDAASLVQLLWKDEAVRLLAARGQDKGVRSLPREAAWERLAATVDLDELRAEVRTVLKVRRGWRDDRGRARCDETVRRADTSSRFLARRMSR
ncbi:sce7726 family protein [Nocardioides imazamoxiresistens]|uniref:sce7726 family protein n=1 Tax=Nocardioides imazamoxiresistens TaxID=3231893 RepID=UPI0034D95A02